MREDRCSEIRAASSQSVTGSGCLFFCRAKMLDEATYWEEMKLLDQMRSYLYPGSPGRTFWNTLSRLRLLFNGFSQCRVRFPGLDLGSASVTSISGRFWVFHHSVGILLWTSPLASS